MFSLLEAIVVTWLAVGLLVGVPFLAFAVGRVVEGAAGSSLMFRLMMLPGAALLWPVLLYRGLTAARRDGHA
ncbi:MAG: hypothetical protein IT181_14160 [Acidobacteria bacterium]|nr:hypothetical protein [Acidobacteriota bacterium]